MPFYRFYFVTAESGLIGVPAPYECVDDAETLAMRPNWPISSARGRGTLKSGESASKRVVHLP
jgi:hypothetical protein